MINDFRLLRKLVILPPYKYYGQLFAYTQLLILLVSTNIRQTEHIQCLNISMVVSICYLQLSFLKIGSKNELITCVQNISNSTEYSCY